MAKRPIMQDRILRGALAGVIGCVWLFAFNFFSHWILHFARTSWVESMSHLVLSHAPKGTMEFIAGTIILFMWNGFMGMLYTWLVIPERDGNYIGRAILFGLAAWFAIFVLGTFYKIPTLDKAPWQTAFSNWIAIGGWGVIVGWLTERWDDLEARRNERVPRTGKG